MPLAVVAFTSSVSRNGLELSSLVFVCSNSVEDTNSSQREAYWPREEFLRAAICCGRLSTNGIVEIKTQRLLPHESVRLGFKPRDRKMGRAEKMRRIRDSSTTTQASCSDGPKSLVAADTSDRRYQYVAKKRTTLGPNRTSRPPPGCRSAAAPSSRWRRSRSNRPAPSSLWWGPTPQTPSSRWQSSRSNLSAPSLSRRGPAPQTSSSRRVWGCAAECRARGPPTAASGDARSRAWEPRAAVAWATATPRSTRLPCCGSSAALLLPQWWRRSLLLLPLRPSWTSSSSATSRRRTRRRLRPPPRRRPPPQSPQRRPNSPLNGRACHALGVERGEVEAVEWIELRRVRIRPRFTLQSALKIDL
ncbi:hypothetical protein EJB05_56313 [Eragrostis curvula]|uniref:Uncharacterized protein n=1 Tax=Eragrostis curvula TaxID=38414 RepID=A0A5J9SHR2_9POAL|nr:hypothetical protein EJB05_56313 [Eragrostis curvula]